MLAQQLKICPGMIKDGWYPPGCCMTPFARNAQRSLVDIIHLVTGVTISRSGLKLRNGVGGGMTVIADAYSMLTGQREGVNIMVEGLTIGINTVMACQAIIAERLHMRGNKIEVHLFVTGKAYDWIE
jgi:hypothetical protein